MTSQGGGSPSETWRLIIIQSEAAEILVESDGMRFSLPEVDIPAHQRIAVNINRLVEREFGLRVISLYDVASRDAALPNTALYYAAVALQPTQAPRAGTCWTYIRLLKSDSFSRDGEFSAVDAFLSRIETAKRNRTPEPFLKPDWFSRVRNWVGRSLRFHSSRLSGDFRQLNASPTFSLIRFETTREPVWCKAVGEPNIREWALTLALARLCPECIPQILARKKGWNAWLAAEVPGNSLTANGEMHSWTRAATDFATLQIASMSDSFKLLKAGAHDLRLSSLVSRVAPFFQFVADCTGRSPLQSSRNLSLLEVSELRDVTRAALEELDGLGLPPTVGHMDLSPGNIFCAGDRAVFLDWAEGFVGNPLFSFEYLLQHFRQTLGREPSLEDSFRNAYFQPWGSRIPPKELERALSLSPLAALFAYATTLWSSAPSTSEQQPLRERYLLTLIRKMKGGIREREPERVQP
jgi:hypothetical protein